MQLSFTAEEEAFRKTLQSGTQIFDLAASEALRQAQGPKARPVLSGAKAFQLHDTYGFPIDLTLEMAAEAGLSVDEQGFRGLMAEQRERAKADARAKKGQHADLSVYREILDAGAVREIFLAWSAERRLLPAADLFRKHVIRRAAAGRLPAVSE